jgi:hypothetical protein
VADDNRVTVTAAYVDEVSPGIKKTAAAVEQSSTQMASGVDKVARAQKKAAYEAEMAAKAQAFLAKEQEKATAVTVTQTAAVERAAVSTKAMTLAMGAASIAASVLHELLQAAARQVNDATDAYHKMNAALRDAGKAYDPIIDAQDRWSEKMAKNQIVVGSYTSRIGTLIGLLASGVPIAAAFAQAAAEAATGRALSQTNGGASGGWKGGPDYTKDDYKQPPTGAEMFNSYWHNKAAGIAKSGGGGGSSRSYYDPGSMPDSGLGDKRWFASSGKYNSDKETAWKYQEPDYSHGITNKYTDSQDKLAESMKKAQKYTDTLAQGISSAFSGMLFDGMKLSDGLKGIFRGLVDDVIGDLSKRAATSIVGAVLGGLSTGGGAVGVQVGPAAVNQGLQEIRYQTARGR